VNPKKGASPRGGLVLPVPLSWVPWEVLNEACFKYPIQGGLLARRRRVPGDLEGCARFLLGEDSDWAVVNRGDREGLKSRYSKHKYSSLYAEAWRRSLCVVFLNSITLALSCVSSSTRYTQSSGLPVPRDGLPIQSPTWMWQSYSSGHHGMLAVMMSLHLLLEAWWFMPNSERPFHSLLSGFHRSLT